MPLGNTAAGIADLHLDAQLEQLIDCLVAHGEGNFQPQDPQMAEALAAAGQIASAYARQTAALQGVIIPTIPMDPSSILPGCATPPGMCWA